MMQRESKREGTRERWDQPDIEIKIRKWLSLQPAGRVLCENTSYRGWGIVCVCVSICVGVCLLVCALDFCGSSLQCHMGTVPIITALSVSNTPPETERTREGG